MELQLRISGYHHQILQDHLLPPDGREAVAVALCGRYSGEEMTIITVHEVTLIPHHECYSREFDLLRWPTERIIPYFGRIAKQDLALLKIHSHPGGYEKFSETDDRSDLEFFDSVFGWALTRKPHASAVMLPGGKIFGRFFFDNLQSQSIDKVLIAGDDIQIYQHYSTDGTDAFSLRTIQTFGERTYKQLKQLKVGVVGCSGTGSPVIEQLVRLGVGNLILVDPDIVEYKNLNRIPHTTRLDADQQRSKVEVLAEAIGNIGLGTKVLHYQANLYDDVQVLKSLVKCDVIFGCMDSVDGRFLLNQLCTFYLIPYFDLGVKLEADGEGGIEKICGSVHYIQPCKSSLITRGVYTMEDVRAAGQHRKNPEEFESLRRSAYITNVNVNSPAVISVNMQIASHAMNEFLNRIHKYKADSSKEYALSTIDIGEGYIVNVAEEQFPIDEYLRKKTGRGDMVPFIEMSEIPHEVVKKNIA